MTNFSRFADYARLSEKLFSRTRTLLPFCCDAELLEELNACATLISNILVHSIECVYPGESFSCLAANVLGGYDLTLVIELYDICGRVIAERHKTHPYAMYFEADIELLRVETDRFRLLACRLEASLTAGVELLL